MYMLRWGIRQRLSGQKEKETADKCTVQLLTYLAWDTFFRICLMSLMNISPTSLFYLGLMLSIVFELFLLNILWSLVLLWNHPFQDVKNELFCTHCALFQQSQLGRQHRLLMANKPLTKTRKRTAAFLAGRKWALLVRKNFMVHIKTDNWASDNSWHGSKLWVMDQHCWDSSPLTQQS